MSNQRRNDGKLSAGVVVEFEYDPAKSAKNLAKHGIDFEQAQPMRSGGKTVTLVSKHAGNDDVRYLVLGMIAGKHWAAITTKRGNRIRLISVRRSRKDEERLMTNANNSQSLDAQQLEQRFDDGEEVLGCFDLDHPVVEHHPVVQKRITLTMPDWIVEGLDEEAEELAISRNAVVNTWLAERIRASRAHSQSAVRA